MTKRKLSIEKIVNKAESVVLNGKTNSSILNQLSTVAEQIEYRHYHTTAEKEAAFPFFKDYSVSELMKIRTALYRALQKKIETNDYTHLQAFRMVVAISCMYPNRTVTNYNNKIKFAKAYWGMCCSCGVTMEKAMQNLLLLD